MWLVHYFTLYKLIRTSVIYINKYVKQIVDLLLSTFEPELKMYDVILNSVEFIEKNTTLLKYSDIQLYEHQKELFTILFSELEFVINVFTGVLQTLNI